MWVGDIVASVEVSTELTLLSMTQYYDVYLFNEPLHSKGNIGNLLCYGAFQRCGILDSIYFCLQ